MEPQNAPAGTDNARKVKPLYWIAAAALTVAIVLDLITPPINWISIAGRVPLLIVLVLLATAKATETHAKKLLIYGLIALSIGLFLVKLTRGA